MWHLVSIHVERMKNLRKEWDSNCLPEDGQDFLGHGICKIFHPDIEYFYHISPSGIKVYSAHLPWDGPEIEERHFKLVESISF